MSKPIVIRNKTDLDDSVILSHISDRPFMPNGFIEFYSYWGEIDKRLRLEKTVNPFQTTYTVTEI